jgi:hypothetical protein
MIERHREELKKIVDYAWPPASSEDLKSIFNKVNEMLVTSDSGTFTQESIEVMLTEQYQDGVPADITFVLDPDKMEEIGKMREHKSRMFSDFIEITDLTFMLPAESRIPQVELGVYLNTKKEKVRYYYEIKYLGDNKFEGFHRTSNELVTTGDVQLIEIGLTQLQAELSAV